MKINEFVTVESELTGARAYEATHENDESYLDINALSRTP